VTAIIQQLLRSLVPSANQGDLVGLGMRLAEVGAQPALPVVNLLHVSPPSKDSGAKRRKFRAARPATGDGRRAMATKWTTRARPLLVR